MTKILCKKLGKKLPALDYDPFPGELGKKIREDFSSEAWDMWLAHQTKLINEYRLDPLDPKSKALLQKSMHDFLYHNEANNPPDFQDSDKGA